MCVAASYDVIQEQKVHLRTEFGPHSFTHALFGEECKTEIN
jgi:hypothetical protein